MRQDPRDPWVTVLRIETGVAYGGDGERLDTVAFFADGLEIQQLADLEVEVQRVSNHDLPEERPLPPTT